MVGFVLGGWDVAEGLVDAVVVVPTDPGGESQFDLGAGEPGLAVDQLLLEGGVDGLGQRVIVRVPATEPTDAVAPISASRSV